MMKSAREDIVLDDNTSKEKGGQPAFKWLKEYAVELVAENDYADDSADDVAIKGKFKALPQGSTLKMVVGFDVGVESTVVVSARPRKKKGDIRDVERVVLATPTSTAVMGIENADGTEAIATVKFTGNGPNSGYTWKCFDDNGGELNPVGGANKDDGDTVECPIARAEPVARTFLVGSGEETTTACMQENALNYLATAAYHDQTLCCVVQDCDSQELSDAYAAASSGCGGNVGGHTDDANGNCQTAQCTAAQLFSAFETSDTCPA